VASFTCTRKQQTLTQTHAHSHKQTTQLTAATFDDDAWTERRTLIMVLAGCCLMLPIALWRDLGALSKTSFISIVAVVFIILSVTIRGPAEATKEHIASTPESYVFMRTSVGFALLRSVISYHFISRTCHIMYFHVFLQRHNTALTNNHCDAHHLYHCSS
jgi:amino acid permease